MAVVSCPKCSTGLRVPDGSVAAVRCPKCKTTFSPPKPAAAAPAFEVVPEPPKPAPRPAAPPPAAGPKFSMNDAVRSAETRPPRARRVADDEDDDRPRRRDNYDDEDDRPRGRSRRDDDEDDRRDRRRRYDDEDDDDYDRDRDRPRKGSKFGLARPAVLLILISLGLYLGGLGLDGLLVFVGWLGADVPYALRALAGVTGLAGWVVALVGFGLAIAGPARARGLAIACAAVGFVHLVLAFVVAYNERADGFGSVRWDALVSDLPQLDRLLVVLVYQARAFGDYLLLLFAGLAELARLILVGLLLGSLARAAKDHRAETQAKIGWIAAPSAVGVAMLVMLLVGVLAESTVKDALRGPNVNPPPQFGPGGDFQENMRRQREWQEQQQAEFRRFEERGRNLARTLRVWTNGGALVILALHGGALVLPVLASVGVFRSMGRRR